MKFTDKQKNSAGKVIETSERLWRNGFKANSADNEGLRLY